MLGLGLNVQRVGSSGRSRIPSLNELTLTNDTFANDAAAETLIGTLVGVYMGSTLELLDDLGGIVTLNPLGELKVGQTVATAGLHTIQVRETNPVYVGSPKTTDLVLTVTLTATLPLSASWAYATGFEDGRLPEATGTPTVVGTLTTENATTVEISSNSFGDKFTLASVGGGEYDLSLTTAADFEEVASLSVTLDASSPSETILTTLDFVVIPGAAQAIRYVAPTAQGTGVGTSAANAAAFTNLNNMIGGTTAGGQVRLLTDYGAYARTTHVTLTLGGTVIAPILVAGYTAAGVADEVDFTGTRTAWTLPVDPEQVTDITAIPAMGNDGFQLNSATAANLTFRDIYFVRFRYPIMINQPSSGLIFENIRSLNTRTTIYSDSTVTGIALLNCEGIGFSKDYVRFVGNTSDIIVEDIYLDSGRIAGDNFAVGIKFDSTAHDAIIRASNPLVPWTIKNCHSYPDTSGYVNGDGISTEGSNYDIEIKHGICSGHTDGGLDLKSSSTTVTGMVCEDNKRNYRFWNTAVDHTMTDCISRNPNPRVATTGGTSGITPTHCWVGSGADLMMIPDDNPEGLLMEDTDPTAIGIHSESSSNILRLNYTYDGLGTALDLHSSEVVYNPWVDEAVAPVITTTAASNVNDGATISLQLAATETNGPVTWRKMSGDTKLSGSQSGLVTATARFFDAPQDADSNNVYITTMRARDGARNAATIDLAFTVLDNGVGLTGSVALGTSHAWRVDKSTLPANVTLSGTENKTATLATSGAALVRGTAPFYPPVNRKTYFEAVSNGARVGLANASESQTVELGTTNHSIGWLPDGSVVLNGVTVATAAGHANGDVLGIATDIGHFDYAEVQALKSRIHEWKIRTLWLYKNGTLVSASGGIDISEIVDALFAAASLTTAGQSVAFRSIASEWTQTPRAGHTGWGIVQKRVVTGTVARYVAASSVGLADGSSWANAATLSELSAMIGRSAARGDTTNPHVFIRADESLQYHATAFTVQNGGNAANNRVTVIGVTEDLIPHPFRTYGNRETWVLPNDPTLVTDGTLSGQNWITLDDGADNLIFSHFYPTRSAAPFYVPTTANISNVTFEDIGFYNNRRGIFNQETAVTSICNDFLFQRIHGTGLSKQGIHISGMSLGCDVTNVNINVGRQGYDSGLAGIKFSSRAQDSTISFAWCRNARGDSSNLGDGIETNNTNDNVNIEDCVLAYCRDGGFDSKADDSHIYRVLAYDNTRNCKIWGDNMVLEDVISYNLSTSTTANQTIFHNGQNPPSRVVWRRYTAINPGTLYMQNWNHTDRFIDSVRVRETSAWAEDSSSNINTTFDSSNGTARVLHGLSSDVTVPTITSTNSASVVGGALLAKTLTANESVTWWIQGGTHRDTNPNYVYDAIFEIRTPFASAPTLRFLNNAAAVYDAVTPANNTKTVTVVATDVNLNETTQLITVTITAP